MISLVVVTNVVPLAKSGGVAPRIAMKTIELPISGLTWLFPETTVKPAAVAVPPMLSGSPTSTKRMRLAGQAVPPSFSANRELSVLVPPFPPSGSKKCICQGCSSLTFFVIINSGFHPSSTKKAREPLMSPCGVALSPEYEPQ